MRILGQIYVMLTPLGVGWRWLSRNEPRVQSKFISAKWTQEPNNVYYKPLNRLLPMT